MAVNQMKNKCKRTSGLERRCNRINLILPREQFRAVRDTRFRKELSETYWAVRIAGSCFKADWEAEKESH